jgi:hypothetical protein
MDRGQRDKIPKITYVYTLRRKRDKGMRSKSMVSFTSKVRKLLKASGPCCGGRGERRIRKIAS